MKISSFQAKAHLIFHWCLIYNKYFYFIFQKGLLERIGLQDSLCIRCTSYVKRGKWEHPKLKLMVHLQTIVSHNKKVKAMVIDENDIQM